MERSEELKKLENIANDFIEGKISADEFTVKFEDEGIGFIQDFSDPNSEYYAPDEDIISDIIQNIAFYNEELSREMQWYLNSEQLKARVKQSIEDLKNLEQV